MVMYTYLTITLWALILPHTKFSNNQADIIKTYLTVTLTPQLHQVEKEHIIAKLRAKMAPAVHRRFAILQNLIYETSEFERWLNLKKIPDHILEGLTKRVRDLETPAGQAITANRLFYIRHAADLRKSKKISDFPPGRAAAISRNYYLSNNHHYLKRMTRELTPTANRIMWKLAKQNVPLDNAALNKLDTNTINRMMTDIAAREKRREVLPESLLEELMKSMNLTDAEFAEYLRLPNDSSGMPTHEYLSNEFLEYSKYQMKRFLKDL